MKVKMFIKLSCILFLAGISYSSYSQPSSSGTLHGTDTVCYGDNNGYLKLSFYLSPIQYWESSVSMTGPWNAINNTIDTLYYSDLVQTTFFRVIVHNGTDYDTSNVQVIYVSPLSAGGILSGGGEVCAGVNSTTISLSAYTGSIVRWEYSEDSGSNWVNIAETNNSHTFSNLAITTLCRVIVKSSPCDNDTSTIEEITVYPQTNAGVLDGDTSLCVGSNTGSLWLTGYTGDIVSWEQSPSGFAPWTNINFTSDTLNYTNISSTSYYRVLVKSGVCSSQYSNSVDIDISTLSEGGILSGAASVCSEANNGTIVLSGYNGDITHWQYSTNYGTSWTDTANINHTLNYSGLTQTTTYRAVVKSGVCPEENSEQGVITVYPLPDVNFMADSVCRGQASTFTNQSSITVGSIINYSWDFGNGQSSNSQHPGYTYPTNGIYTVQLTATSNQGCIDSSFQIVKIYSTPVVGFSVQNACHNIPVNFTNNSYSPTGDNLQFYWDFGDATGFSTDTNPSYIYYMPGTYDVKLVTQSITTGCSDSVIYAATTYPRAVPGFMTENECDGSTADFYNNTTLTSGITNYYWTFGDGAFSIDINPSHLYGTSGNYIVLLQASTDKGCVDTISHTIYIHPVPTAAFNFDDICYTDTVHFTDLSTIDSGSISWLWNFGNGNTSADQNPDYYYSSPGTYLVNLQVVSDSGCVSQIFENIEVFSLPNVNFNFSNSCLSDSVSFNNLTTIQSGNLNYLWDFGNGSTSALKNPVMLFGNAGLYDVQLIAWSGLSCSDSVTKTLQIYPDPVAEFSANNVCDGIPVSFINNSTIESGSVQSYSWDFGDGTNSIQPEPEKLYLNPGSYTVNLDIVSNNGCTGHVQHDITVDYLPLANFNIYNVCHNTPISPDNLSTITSGTLTYKWSFGDTDTSIVPEPNHIYASPGLYPVTLKAYSENSCVDSLIRYVEIFSLPNANAGSDTTISKGQTTMLSGSGGSIYYWFPSTGLSSPARSNPIASPVQTINYVLQVEDYNGCISYDTVKVTVLDDYNITASNIITPDGNGYNDTWNIQNIENYADAEVFIYDKWGNEVFHSNAYQNQWDGKNANGDMLPDGAYFYIIRFADSDIIYKGALTILRNK